MALILRECWINVYAGNVLGGSSATRNDAIWAANYASVKSSGDYKVLYRIHVRLK